MTPVLYGQPIFAVQDQLCSVIGHEVLFRMEVGQERRVIGPAEILSILEPSRMYPFMDASVMNILMSAPDIHSAGDLFINLAPETMQHERFKTAWLGCLKDLCKRFPGTVTVEFSERITEPGAAKQMAVECLEAGARIALDDYTGSSAASRSLLLGVNWDFIKVCAHAITREGIELDRLTATLRFVAAKSTIVFERFELEEVERISSRIPKSCFQSFCLGRPQPLRYAKVSQHHLRSASFRESNTRVNAS